MSYQIVQKIDLNSVVEFDLTNKERLELIAHTYECLTHPNKEKYTKQLLLDMKQVNLEFYENDEVDKALNILIKNHKKI